MPFRFRQKLEIHAIDSGYKGDWHEDDGDHGEEAHGFIHAVINGGHVTFQGGIQQVSGKVQGVCQLDRVVIRIADEWLGFSSDGGVNVPGQARLRAAARGSCGRPASRFESYEAGS